MSNTKDTIIEEESKQVESSSLGDLIEEEEEEITNQIIMSKETEHKQDESMGPAEIENLPESLTESARELYKVALAQESPSSDEESIVNSNEPAQTNARRRKSILQDTGLLDVETGNGSGLFDAIDREIEERRQKEEEEAEQQRRAARKVLGAAFEKYDTTMVRQVSQEFLNASPSASDLDLAQMSKPKRFRNFFRPRSSFSKQQQKGGSNKPISVTEKLQEQSKLKTSHDLPQQQRDSLAFQMKHTLLEPDAAASRRRRKWTIFFLILFLCATLTILVIILTKETLAHSAQTSAKSIVATPDYIVPNKDLPPIHDDSNDV